MEYGYRPYNPETLEGVNPENVNRYFSAIDSVEREGAHGMEAFATFIGEVAMGGITEVATNPKRAAMLKMYGPAIGAKLVSEAGNIGVGLVSIHQETPQIDFAGMSAWQQGEGYDALEAANIYAGATADDLALAA